MQPTHDLVDACLCGLEDKATYRKSLGHLVKLQSFDSLLTSSLG